MCQFFCYREVLLHTLNIGVVGSLFSFGAAPRPSGLGVKDYGSVRALGLCPSTNNCISTAEEANDVGHFVPPCAPFTNSLTNLLLQGSSPLLQDESPSLFDLTYKLHVQGLIIRLMVEQK
jgi:hypothetical protein